jgi:hypothetical protein
MLGEKRKSKQTVKPNKRRKLLNNEPENVWGEEEEAEVSSERNEFMYGQTEGAQQTGKKTAQTTIWEKWLMRGWIQLLVHWVVEQTISKCLEDQAEWERKICDDRCWDSSIWDDWVEEGNDENGEKVDIALYVDILDELDRESREYTDEIKAVIEQSQAGGKEGNSEKSQRKEKEGTGTTNK